MFARSAGFVNWIDIQGQRADKNLFLLRDDFLGKADYALVCVWSCDPSVARVAEDIISIRFLTPIGSLTPHQVTSMLAPAALEKRA